jgi:hydrogenase maturation protease
LLIGIGNPIMGDDGVGIHVLRQLKERIPTQDDLEFKELSVGGIKLIEEILDYKTVFIIDSIESADAPGKIKEFSPQHLKSTYHDTAAHSTNFATALELYKKLAPSRMPEQIRIFTITIQPEYIFREKLSPRVRTAASHLTTLLTKEIQRTQNT